MPKNNSLQWIKNEINKKNKNKNKIDLEMKKRKKYIIEKFKLNISTKRI